MAGRVGTRSEVISICLMYLEKRLLCGMIDTCRTISFACENLWPLVGPPWGEVAAPLRCAFNDHTQIFCFVDGFAVGFQNAICSQHHNSAVDDAL